MDISAFITLMEALHLVQKKDIANVYRKTNIIAAVTQDVGGTPTGGIIEIGSNGNGNYVKFAGGLLICWNKDAVAQPVSTPSGNLFCTAPQTRTFPSSFSSAPTAMTAAMDATIAPCWGSSCNTSTTQISAAYLFSGVSTARAKFAYLAIGKWN